MDPAPQTPAPDPRLIPLTRAFARSAEEAAGLHAEMLRAAAAAGTAGAEPLRRALEVCRTYARRRRLERAVAEKLAAAELPVSARGDPAAGEEFPAALEDALGRLAPEQAEALRLCALAGMTPAGAAEVLGRPEGAVRRALFTARRHLADLLTSGGGGAQ
jgi:DNA-directed RNA polymerase specialized sigma24 family protein